MRAAATEETDETDVRASLTRHDATRRMQSTVEIGLQNPGHGFDSRRRLQEPRGLHLADRARDAAVENFDDERANTTIGFPERAVTWFADHAGAVRPVMSADGSRHIAHDDGKAAGSLRRLCG